MRVSLIHNPSAGSGSPTREELMAWLSDAGHDARYTAVPSGAAMPLHEDTDLILVAGGDGTVGRVIRAVPEGAPPIALLPLGTANNVAQSLGVAGTPHAIILGLADAPLRSLDVGLAQSPGLRERFVESAGLGVFATLLRDARREEQVADLDVSERDLVWGRGNRLRRLLAREPMVRRRIVVDGKDHSSKCLFVAAFNIPVIGPRLALAPGADPSDGYLDLLIVRPDDRGPLDVYLEAIAADGPATPFPLELVRCRHVELDWDVSAGHLDDHDWPRRNGAWIGPTDGATVVISVGQRVRVLVAQPPEPG